MNDDRVPESAGTPDFSRGLEDLAGLITFRVGAWHDFGYETPPAPECKPIPPLGERSAGAIKAGHEAIEAIDELARQLYALRDQLIIELRQDEDLRAARVDALLADLRAERDEATAAPAGIRARQDFAPEHQGAAAADVDDELQPVVCLRAISTDKGQRACLLPVDHEADAACPGNPHARPAPAEDADDFVQDRHADLDAGENGGAMTDADYYDRTAEDGAP